MLDVLSVAEIRAAEKIAMTECGLSEDILIENASMAAKELVAQMVEKCDKIAIIVGGGNNGSDGLSLARMLFLQGYDVEIFSVSKKKNAANLARFTAAIKLGMCVTELENASEFCEKKYKLIVDGMLGIGLDKNLDGLILDVVERINLSGAAVLALDIPTGLNANSGYAMPTAVIASKTIAFSAVMLGAVCGEGRNYIGELVLANIGIRAASDIKIYQQSDAKLPKRKAVSHKYNYGRVRIIAGSSEMVGASILALESATAALKCGAGLVTLCAPKSLAAVYGARVRESTLILMPDEGGKVVFDSATLDRIMEKTSAIVVGMGMGANKSLPQIIGYLAQNFDGTLILDADALNEVAARQEVLLNAKASLILTPHMGEFRRLIGEENFREGDEIALVKSLAARLGAVVVAKSATTIISDGEKVVLNVTGTPAMAKGGSGDVLGGMIAAFSARFSPLEAAVLACYHFGKNGERAEKIYGAESVLASDLIMR